MALWVVLLALQRCAFVSLCSVRCSAVLLFLTPLRHPPGYSLETNRFGSQGDFSLYDLWDTYLPPYEAAFVGGGASGSMCSYVSLNIGIAPSGGPYVPACVRGVCFPTAAALCGKGRQSTPIHRKWSLGHLQRQL